MKLYRKIGNMKEWGFFILLIFYQNYSTAACMVSGSLSFGQYSPFVSGYNDSSGNISVQCGLNLIIQVKISTGQSGIFNQRYLSNVSMPQERIAYNLFADNSKGTIFGDGNSNTYFFNGLILLGANIPIYGRIAPGQYAAPGLYTDNIFITVIF